MFLISVVAQETGFLWFSSCCDPRRYLRAKGFCVVNISDKSWEQMGFQEQVSDLAMKIQQAQKQPTGKSFVGPSQT